MLAYTAKQALIDLGFIDGYLHETDNLPRDWCMFESLFDALERIEEYAVKGHLVACPPTDSPYPQFLHDLGFVRGLIWSHPISSAVSEAIGRVIGFATDSDDFPCRLLDGCGESAESPEHRLCDDQRNMAIETALAGEDAHSPEFAAMIGASPADDTSTPRLKEWHSIPEAQVEAVRRMSETMTDDEIAVAQGVSRDTVIRFRKKHGIEKTAGPREGRTRWEYQWEPWQKQKLIEMKQAGASYGEISKVVGKTPNQCSGMWHWEKKKLEAAAESPPDVVADTADEDSSPPDLANLVYSPADRWKPSPIDAAEWPDIQEMLGAGRSREAIASDYDVPVEDLDEFIADRLLETQERHRQKAEVKSPPGEARALSPVGAGSAA